MSPRALTCVDCSRLWTPGRDQARDVRCPACQIGRAARETVVGELVRTDHGRRMIDAALRTAVAAVDISPNLAGPAHLTAAIHDVSRSRRTCEMDAIPALHAVAAAALLWASELEDPIAA